MWNMLKNYRNDTIDPLPCASVYFCLWTWSKLDDSLRKIKRRHLSTEFIHFYVDANTCQQIDNSRHLHKKKQNISHTYSSAPF